MQRGIVAGILFLLASCGEELRSPPMPYELALADRRPRQLRVLEVHDLMNERFGEGRSVHTSHLIEVEILDGPEAGSFKTLPYDEWNRGGPPPAKGTELVAAPADWVTRDPRSKGRPYAGWEEAR